MKAKFSKSWKSSKQPRKQRKYRYNAPLHIKQAMVASHLSPELREKHGKRAVPSIKGDTVKVMRGKFKGRTGKINRVNLKLSKVYIDGLEIAKKDGTKAFNPINASNVMITQLRLEDSKRLKEKK